MSNEVSNLLQQGVQMKREGLLKESKENYVKAIDLDPKNMNAFMGLGKTSYLLNERNLSVLCYLAVIHLNLYTDTNTPRHLGHSIIDLAPEILQEMEGLHVFAEIYHAHIYGNGSYNRLVDDYNVTPQQQLEIDEKVYIPNGVEFLLNNIKWDDLESDHVIDIYF
ncbi:hypothetical protein SPD48_18645 [Pseudogracilibacillus sp. SE30717A]|uniref:hypothetical protein n=1 Tax=Pseudogracilibacillus sp. SE30717A TaxID=3098293 RepID=UPI00300DE112